MAAREGRDLAWISSQIVYFSRDYPLCLEAVELILLGAFCLGAGENGSGPQATVNDGQGYGGGGQEYGGGRGPGVVLLEIKPMEMH